MSDIIEGSNSEVLAVDQELIHEWEIVLWEYYAIILMNKWPVDVWLQETEDHGLEMNDQRIKELLQSAGSKCTEADILEVWKLISEYWDLEHRLVTKWKEIQAIYNVKEESIFL